MEKEKIRSAGDLSSMAVSVRGVVSVSIELSVMTVLYPEAVTSI